MPNTYYERAVDSWGSYESVVLRSRDGTIVASFPLPFIQRGGNNTWGYILDVVDRLVNTDPNHPWAVRDHEDQVVDPTQPPRGGLYLFDLLGMWVRNKSSSERISGLVEF
jgi:hypothetical protein